MRRTKTALVIYNVRNSLRHRRSVIGRQISKFKVCSGSCHPKEAMPWIQETELANSIDDLRTSQSITGRVCPNIETLDERIATPSNKIVQGSTLKKKIFLEAHKAQNEDRIPDPSRMSDRLYDRRELLGDRHSRVHPWLHGSDQLYSTRGDDVQGSDTRWDEVL